MAPDKRGGKRPGAGRPPLNVKPLSVTLAETDIEYLKTINNNLSAAIRSLIAAARKS